MPRKTAEGRKAYNKEYSKRWYAKNREKQKARAAANRKRYYQEWIEYKASLECSVCGASHPAIIDFHHIIRKDKQSVNILVKNGRFAAARKEAETKCIPICANCHRKHHWEERRNTPPKDRT